MDNYRFQVKLKINIDYLEPSGNIIEEMGRKRKQARTDYIADILENKIKQLLISEESIPFNQIEIDKLKL